MPLLLTLNGERPELGIAVMRFWHDDFQSHLNFRVEDHLLMPAIIVGYYAFGDQAQA